MRIIHEQSNYRIIELADEFAEMENLKGDTYNVEVNSDISPEVIRKQEVEFEQLVNSEGVYGYELQVWNPEVGQGWEHVDSCWGFVGQYSETEELFNHYIIDELKSQIK